MQDANNSGPQSFKTDLSSLGCRNTEFCKSTKDRELVRRTTLIGERAYRKRKNKRTTLLKMMKLGAPNALYGTVSERFPVE